MKITYLHIHNYRNLSDLEIHLNPRNNFIVGENNLGKSNFLQLLNIIFFRKSFLKDDFTDVDQPVDINFKLKLEHAEIGLFEDFFDPMNSDDINIKAIQNTIDDPIEFFHIESGTRIPSSVVKCINFLYYDSIRNPTSELSFNKTKGVGKFLHHIIVKHLENNNETNGDFINEEKTTDLAVFVNEIICKIKAFKQYSITAEVENDVENLLSKILILKDDNDKYIRQAGYGVQFLSIITLAVLQKILETKELKRDRGIVEYKEEDNPDVVKKAISLVIGFDEPEIHLHPYLQRSLVKYINRILNNEEVDFLELINSIFDLGKVIGQSIIATHSPNIILNDYTEVIRFYKSDSALSVVSGANITVEEDYKKHLSMQFPFIKEAFFARFVLVVEGVTELSAFPGFGEKLGYDFDEHGISIIEVSGKGSVEPVLALLSKFKIQCLGIVDKDDDAENTNALIKQTEKRDFEVEVISHLIDAGKEEILRKIVNEYTGAPETYEGVIIYEKFETKKLQKIKNRYNSFIDSTTETPNNLKLSDISQENIKLKKLWYLTWFISNKDIVLGKIIGDNLEESEIPEIYKNIINTAVLS